MKPLKYHSEAADEFKQAVTYYEECVDGLGLEFDEIVVAAEHHIQRHPSDSSHYKRGFRRKVLARFPYAMFYKEFDDYIWIAAVANCHREPDYWMGRRPE